MQWGKRGFSNLILNVFQFRLSSIEGCLPLKVVFYQMFSSIEGHLLPKVAFHQCRLPPKVVCDIDKNKVNWLKHFRKGHFFEVVLHWGFFIQCCPSSFLKLSLLPSSVKSSLSLTECLYYHLLKFDSSPCSKRNSC